MRDAVDFRSDTVTRPTPAMRDAMHAAAVGDDVFGEDPTINRLEEVAAERTGHEAALWVPSGCMANLVAHLVHVRRGDLVLTPADSHIVAHEVGAGAALAGAQYEVLPRPRITAEDVDERVKKPTFHEPGTGLVWVENTHNMAGGVVMPLEELRSLSAACARHGLPLHLDGARVFNAAVALGVPVRELASLATSVSFCLSKGLGAPAGSMFCGTRAMREAGLRFRKMLGGGMRQVGILAAAGLYALEHHVARLAEDHARARRLAERLALIPGLDVRPEAVQTNIVMVGTGELHAEVLAERCAARGVLFLAMDRRRVRFVTHYDVDDTAVDRAVEGVTDALRA